jgi:hypothetical protein
LECGAALTNGLLKASESAEVALESAQKDPFEL